MKDSNKESQSTSAVPASLSGSSTSCTAPPSPAQPSAQHEKATKTTVPTVVTPQQKIDEGALAMLQHMFKNITLVQQPTGGLQLNPSVPPQTELVDDGNALIINPAMENNSQQRSEDDVANEPLVQRLKQKKPQRYEDGATQWKCSFCASLVNNGEIHFRCSECDEHVLCAQCYRMKPQSKHLHFGMDFFYAVTKQRWAFKVELSRCSSCSQLITKGLSTYADRKFICQAPHRDISDQSGYSPLKKKNDFLSSCFLVFSKVVHLRGYANYSTTAC